MLRMMGGRRGDVFEREQMRDSSDRKRKQIFRERMVTNTVATCEIKESIRYSYEGRQTNMT